MASQQISHVEKIISNLKSNAGFKAFFILNTDGVVLKWDEDQLSYQKAVQYANHVLDVCTRSKAVIKDLFDPQDNQVESIRMRTEEHELIIAQHGNFILVVIQDGLAYKGDEEASEEKKDEAEELKGI